MLWHGTLGTHIFLLSCLPVTCKGVGKSRDYTVKWDICSQASGWKEDGKLGLLAMRQRFVFPLGPHAKERPLSMVGNSWASSWTCRWSLIGLLNKERNLEIRSQAALTAGWHVGTTKIKGASSPQWDATRSHGLCCAARHYLGSSQKWCPKSVACITI